MRRKTAQKTAMLKQYNAGGCYYDWNILNFDDAAREHLIEGCCLLCCVMELIDCVVVVG